MEQLHKANIYVFDKTGTLTKGNFVVTRVFPEENKEEILRLAAIAEAGSNHPIAQSILKLVEVNETGYTIENIAGYGIVAKKEDIILCGNDKLMEQRNISYVKEMGIGTVVYVAKNDKFIGSILISDEIKEETEAVIRSLNKMGGKTIMLTGDNEAIAQHVSKQIGVTEFKASLLPQNKVEEVEKL